MLIPLYEYVLKTPFLVAQLVKDLPAIRRSSSIPRFGRSAGEGIGYPLHYSWASLVAQLVKKLPAMWETWLQSLSWEDPLEKKKSYSPLFWPGEFHGLYSWNQDSQEKYQ